jgi:hypothetical protein
MNAPATPEQSTCHFQPGPGGGKVCTGAGNMTACQLCTRSQTYWRNTTTAACDPWNGIPKQPVPELDMTGWRDNRTDNAEACALCGVTTTWITPGGKRCHPSCATLSIRERARQAL